MVQFLFPCQLQEFLQDFYRYRGKINNTDTNPLGKEFFMSIFALADLHLSGNPPLKPMDRFSPAWENHWEKVQAAWLATITPEDTILIAGDTSWAMK